MITHTHNPTVNGHFLLSFPFLSSSFLPFFPLLGVVAQSEAWRRCAEARLGLGPGLELGLGQEPGLVLDHDPDVSSVEHDDDQWEVRGPEELSILSRLGRASAADKDTLFHTSLHSSLHSSAGGTTFTSLDDDEDADNYDLQYPTTTTTTPGLTPSVRGSTLLKSPSQPNKDRSKQTTTTTTTTTTATAKKLRSRKQGRVHRSKGRNNLWDHLLNHGKDRNRDKDDAKEGQDADAPWGDQHRYVDTQPSYPATHPYSYIHNKPCPSNSHSLPVMSPNTPSYLTCPRTHLLLSHTPHISLTPLSTTNGAFTPGWGWRKSYTVYGRASAPTGVALKPWWWLYTAPRTLSKTT